jgi:hypothetical protein
VISGLRSATKIPESSPVRDGLHDRLSADIAIVNEQRFYVYAIDSAQRERADKFISREKGCTEIS